MALSSATKVRSELEIYKEKTGENADVFDFFHSVLKVQNRTYKNSRVSFRVSIAALQKRLKNSQRLVKPREVSIPRREYLETLKRIEGEINKRWMVGKRLKQFSRLEELNSDKFAGFISGMVSGKSGYLKGLPTKTHTKKATLQFALESAAMPFMAKISSDVSKKVDLSLWQKGTCPVCGRYPVVAKMRKDDGARFLYCGFCATQWRFPRLTCVNCGNTDQSTMKYFFPEADRGHRVDVCDVCKKSVRTTDERALGRETFFEVENWVTSYLNDVAIREGYKPLG